MKSDAAITGAASMLREAERALAKVQDMADRDREGDARTRGGEDARTAGNTTHTVNIIRSGRRDSVNVASPADANTLTGILRELESAAGAAS